MENLSKLWPQNTGIQIPENFQGLGKLKWTHKEQLNLQSFSGHLVRNPLVIYQINHNIEQRFEEPIK